MAKSNRTVITCDKENDEVLNPRRIICSALGMVLQMQVTDYTKQLLSIEYQLLQLRRSIRNHA